MTEPGARREPDDGLGERLDALEEKVLGERADQTRDEDDDSSPAFEQDVDLDEDVVQGPGTEPP